LIYDMKSQNYKTMQPKHQLNVTDLGYGHHGRRTDDHRKDEGERDPPNRQVVSLCFSKDAKFLACILSDQFLDTKALIYDI
jgi:hypothetical protein